MLLSDDDDIIFVVVVVVVVVVVDVVAIHCIALLTFTGGDSFVPPLSPLLMFLSYRLPKCWRRRILHIIDVSRVALSFGANIQFADGLVVVVDAVAIHC